MSWVDPVDLDRAFVFLSASFPTPARADAFPPAQPDDIADAVSAVARGVLASGGRLVFGGHPTITPLVLLVASEMASLSRSRDEGWEGQPRVWVYQSRLYADAITPETWALEERGHGRIEWVEAASGETVTDNRRSLQALRERMLGETRPIAGFFIGGMEGVPDERNVATATLGESFLAFPLSRPGGAAATLAPPDGIDAEIARLLASRAYPAAVQAALTVISR